MPIGAPRGPTDSIDLFTMDRSLLPKDYLNAIGDQRSDRNNVMGMFYIVWRNQLTSNPETSGFVTCKTCRPFLDEIEDKQRFVCNQLVDYTTCNACDEHDIRDNRDINRVPPLDQYEGGIDYDDTDT